MTELHLADAHARMGKISNNLETHGDDEVTGFTIPCEMMIDEPALDALMGVYFHRALFNTDAATSLQAPMDGFIRCKALELDEKYEDCSVGLTLSGDNYLEFEECSIGKIVMEPQLGGLTKLKVAVYLRPGIGANNLALQEHQHREIGLTISGGKLALKKDAKQQELPLEAGGGFSLPKEACADLDAEMGERAMTQAVTGDGSKVIDGTTTKSRAKALADKAAH